MEQPGYTDITRIVELHDPVEVNDHLARGWRLLSVRTGGTADAQQTIYILGLPRPGSGDTSPPQQVTPPVPGAPRATHSGSAANRPAVDTSEPRGRRATARPGRAARPAVPPEPPPRPITLVTRLVIPESATSKRRRKQEVPPPPPRELSEEEQREAAGWEQVKETGKPVLVGDKLLIPGEMSPWDAIEHLPDGLREHTRKAMQEKMAGVVTTLIKRMRDRLLTELGDEDDRAQYRTHPYAVQMAMAETLVRHQLGWPEAPMKDLLRQYGAVLEEDLRDTRTED